MRHLGYIYKYSEIEQKGILVYGQWKNEYTKCNIVLLFTKDDCQDNICENQMVYFDLTNNKVSNISRASLASFDKSLILGLITESNMYKSSDWYFQSTHFVLNDTKNESLFCREIYYDSNTFNIEELFDGLEDGYSSFDKDIPNLFSDVVDILDIKLWIYSDIDCSKCFGKTTEEVCFLFNVFAEKRSILKNGEWSKSDENNTIVHPIFTDLIKAIPDNELQIILSRVPLIQPCLPIEFCENHVELLSFGYMPDVRICELYCNHCIKKVKTASEYNDMKEQLNIFRNCGADHSSDYGIPMCRMDEKTISVLDSKLEKQFERVVKKGIVDYYLNRSKAAGVNSANELLSFSKAELLILGEIIIDGNEVNMIDFSILDNVKKAFGDFTDDRKEAIKPYITSQINSIVYEYSKSESPSPYFLTRWFNDYSDWVDADISEQIRNVVYPKFLSSDDLEILYDAFRGNFIDEEQYSLKYQQITCKYSANELYHELTEYSINTLPISIQRYIVFSIINQCNYTSLNSYEDMMIECNGRSVVHSVHTLLKWMKFQVENFIDHSLFEEAINLIIGKLCEEERWMLFEEGYISSPGEELVRRQLDKAYDNKLLHEELYKEECFQKMMMQDLCSSNDDNTEEQMYIYDNLSFFNQLELTDDINDFLKLYIWQKNPYEMINEDILFSQMSKLQDIGQIRIIKYLFSRMAQKSISYTVGELCEKFSKSEKPLCASVRCIMELLKEVVENGHIENKANKIKEIVGIEYNDDFLRNSSLLYFFSRCDGYLSFDSDDSWDDQKDICVNVKEITKEEKSYYVMSFDSSMYYKGECPELVERNRDLLREAIEQTVPFEKIGNDYWIDSSYKKEVKQLVFSFGVDDLCHLFSWWLLPSNRRVVYEQSPYPICKCNNNVSFSPKEEVPFMWCDKHICLKTLQYPRPWFRWGLYTIYDFLYILMGMKKENLDIVRHLQSEIIQCIIPDLKEDSDIDIWSEDTTLFNKRLESEYDEEIYDSDC